MVPLAIGHKNLLQTLKICAAYCKTDGSPIVDWTAVTKKDFDDFKCSQAFLHATKINDIIAPPTMPVTISKSSSTSSGMQGHFGLTDGKDALHHVLSEVLCQPWCGPLVEALERSGFDEIQDVLLMNWATWDELMTVKIKMF